MPLDPELKSPSPFNQIEIPIPESRLINFVLRKFHWPYLSRPDSKYLFHWQWKKAIRKMRRNPDIIYSRSFPISSAVMALKIKMKTGKPWVLHISDPWSLSPVHTYSPAEQEYHNQMEKKCFREADAICMTSESTVKLYKEKYKDLSSKFHCFPNVYDKAPLAPKSPSPDGLFHLVYTGSFTTTRTAKPLLEALAILNKKIPNLHLKFKVTLAGEFDRFNSSLIGTYPFAFMHTPGRLNYSEAIQLQKEADLLLAIDAPLKNPKDAVFFPSKLLDYAISGTPFFSITNEGSESALFTEAIGYPSFLHTDHEKIALFLNDCLEKRASPSDTNKIQTVLAQYHADYQATRLVTLFTSLLK